MMNNKGFTVVELLASFTVTMLIIVFLMEIVLHLKNVYYDTTVKTDIVNTNAMIATTLNNKLDKFRVVDASNDIAGSGCTVSDDDFKYVVVKSEENENYYGYFLVELDTDNNKLNIKSCDTSITQIDIPFPDDVTISNEVFNANKDSFNNFGKRDSYIKISYKVSSTKTDVSEDFNYVYLFNKMDDKTSSGENNSQNESSNEEPGSANDLTEP